VNLFKFQMRMSINYFIWRTIKILMFNSYIYNSDSGSRHHWAPATNFRINLNIRMFRFGLQIPVHFFLRLTMCFRNSTFIVSSQSKRLQFTGIRFFQTFCKMQGLNFPLKRYVDVTAQSHRHKSFHRILCNGVFNGKERNVS